MNKNIDLTELLKECPKGTKFYSRSIGTVTFNCIKSDRVCIKNHKGIETAYTKSGKFYYAEEDAEIDLFPSKDQRDWSKWHRPFKDGDILAYMFWRKPTIYIYREGGTHNTSYYVAYSSDNNKLYTDAKGALASNRDDLRFATEEEKMKLFSVIKEKGYKWDPETKTLEKVIEPKFKVGDRIRKKGDYIYGIIKHIDIDNFYKVEYSGGGEAFVNVKYQDEYELVPNKFDPKTFQPFDKVLVRQYAVASWGIDFYSYYDEQYDYAVCTGDVHYDYCIPYNDDTKHLVGKSEEAPEFYRYWKNK